ncbi:TrbI/VirB10 family protein [Pseudomonas aeruginosa]|uniref:TrbI/VirB10 family protein n=1 Tax=Pseudomonas aeruginosa TaxID=287 RepID=UPI000F53C823|nr:TrbI/VirB10 family protein [Pseudomonas aeruginosa]RQE42067.1 conjugal transfer protein [Pseudomonas aeruginosa]HBO4433066.1 TrbI/VirB10 family protein [Pseudomonas aeruginosa]
MADEAQPRIRERPAAHRTKLQRWLFASIGLILVALVLNFIWFKANGGSGSRQSAAEQRQQQRQSSNMGAGTSQFGDLVSRQQSRLAERNSFQEQVDEAAGELKTTGQQAWSQFQGREDTSKANQGKGKAREPSAEQKAYAKWRSDERMRALKSAQSPWGYTDAVAKAQRVGAGGAVASRGPYTTSAAAEAQNLLNSPTQAGGSLEARRKDLRQRIEAAERLRKELQSAPPGEEPSFLAQKREELEQVKKTFTPAPTDVVGYTKENPYNADIEGMLKLPPGTEIPAQFMRKGVSDFQGGQLKGLVSRDVYDITRQHVAIPKGAEIIMRVHKAGNVNEAIQRRMGITNDWVVLPDGNKIDMSKAAGLDREGVAAIADQVDYHLLSQFLGVAAYALIGSSTSRSGSGSDNDSTFAGDVGDSSRRQASSLVQKYLNIVPTITIRPGQTFYVSLEDDVYVKPWKHVYEDLADY